MASAEAVVIGGGVNGASALFHLAQAGVRAVVLAGGAWADRLLLLLGVDLGLTSNRLQVVIFRWPEALQRGHMTFIARPGAYLWIGNGPGADLHTNAYDFNDTLLPIGAAGWVRLAEAALAAR